MSNSAERLKQARETRYASAADAARALGVSNFTYSQYENGLRGFSRHADRFARLFGVSLDWLLTGRGDMRPSRRGAVPIMGYVGAGATVDPINNAADAEFPDAVDVPSGDTIAALVVKGDSQYPRFMDGEIILYDTRSLVPDAVMDRYAVVHTLDGRALIKIVRRSGRNGFYRLESHNAPPEDVELMGVQRYLGTLSPSQSRPVFTQIRKR